MRRQAIGAALAAAVLAAGAAAQDEPTAIADAKLGSLHVTTAIYVAAKTVDMRGIWLDTKVKCSVTRKLKVRAEVNFIPAGGKPKRFVRSGTFADANCGEGGPNVGFTISAKAAGFACPNGAWKPGRYDFVASTIEPARQLRALADLGWFKRGRC